MRRALPIALVMLLTALPASASDDGDYLPHYTGEQFQAMYEYAIANTLPNLNPTNGQTPVTGDEELDARLWDAAFERGYTLQPSAAGDLVSIDGTPMQPQAAEAWTALEAEARSAGYSFIVSSAYRSEAGQRSWFLGKMTGTSDEAIEDTLRWYSLPGTSKHHTGYALDFRYEDGTFGEFRSTPDYAWLSADNFAIPKKHGFIPSYPDDVENQGPNPEPWEFVWVGLGLIRCGVPINLSQSQFATSHRWLTDDVVGCPGGVSLAELDGLLKSRGSKIEAMLRA